jgi:nickel/cobalt transporter (NicO) family protein
MLMKRLALTGLILAALTATVCAHPIAPDHHDRFVLVRLTPSAVLVEYTLALDSRTMVKDLLPFPDIDWMGGQKKVEKAYSEIYGPRVAEGVFAQTSNQELAFRCERVDVKEEADHWRFVFLLKAPLHLGARPKHRFLLTDSNFATQAGVFKLAVRSEGLVEILESNVESDLERAHPYNLRGFNEKDEQIRSTKVTFQVRAAAAAPSEPAITTSPPPQVVADNPLPTEEEDRSFWAVVRSRSLKKLVESDLGLGLLMVVALVFGAFHALQPGHGKTLVAAYLVGERGTILHALYLGVITTITHTGIVILLAIVVPKLIPDADAEIMFGLSLGCGLLVVLMACWMLLRRLAGQADHFHLFGGHQHHHGPGGHHHHHHHPPDGSTGPVGWGALTLLGMTGGLVPCVDALALVTATWVSGQFSLGLPLILMFSLGLASVLVAVGVMVVKFKQFAGSKWGEGRGVKALPIFSAFLTLALGLWMCHEALQTWQ